MKEILIINGSGGVGKDTFVDKLSRYAKVIHTSIVNPVKDLAKKIGWTGSKTEKDRKFLSDLKVLIDEYNDYNYENVAKLMRAFRNGEFDADILCIDMREKNQIEKAQKEFGAKTVLVTRDSVAHITSNIADKGVYDIEYDYHIENNGSIYDLDEKAKQFLSELSKPKYKKVIYISHPFNNNPKNKQRVERIIELLEKTFPENLFISAIHAFGHEYARLPYERGIAECLWLLDKCDEVWVFGNYSNSQGCMTEIKYCEEHNIPYVLAEEGGSVIA